MHNENAVNEIVPGGAKRLGCHTVDDNREHLDVFHPDSISATLQLTEQLYSQLAPAQRGLQGLNHQH